MVCVVTWFPQLRCYIGVQGNTKLYYFVLYRFTLLLQSKILALGAGNIQVSAGRFCLFFYP